MQGKHLGQLNLALGPKRSSAIKISGKKRKAIKAVKDKLLEDRISELKETETQPISIKEDFTHQDFVA